MYDIIIVGAGPAGLTAAIYGKRGGMSTVMIDKFSFGGQILDTPEIENYPGFKNVTGMNLANSLYEQANNLGAEMKYGNVISIVKDENEGFKVTIEGGEEVIGKSVIVATGAKARPMGLPKEDMFRGAGISYCATCDGNFFRDKVVAVLGGGNVALEDAEVLAGICKKVYLIHRRDEFRGDATNVARVKAKENVEIILDSVPIEILGDTKVSGLKIKNKKTEEERALDLDGIFVAFGNVPDNKNFENVLNLDKAGYVDSGEDCHTKTEGIFVAGDTRKKKVKQIVTATSDGAVASLAAIEYVNSLK